MPEPSEGQRRAGNYKMGRVSLHGLNLAIEQPRGSMRSGVDEKTGKPWSTRMAAHYGYINGTKGNDGDCVDCFIGFEPQSERAYVINQNVNGQFDEHKVMLAFPDLASARRAYLDSYERGWDGLESIVPTSISQLKWWLTNGDMRCPLHAENLPKEGLEIMTRKVNWKADAQPYGTTLAQVLYDIRRSDSGEGLLLDAVTAQEIIDDSDGALALDALVTPYAKLERKMELLRGIMERAGGNVKPVALQITDPFKQRGVANVAAIFELSDGQTVSIFFHNPDVTPSKMAPADEVISWKWLLNKKDITIVVAPERGADLNIREVARRIMRLAEKNSEAFQRVNATRAARMQNIQTLKDEIAGLETELATAQHELEVAKVDAEDAQNKKSRAYAEAVQQVSTLQDAYLRATQNGGTDPKTGKTKEALAAQIDSQAVEVQRLRDIANGVTPVAPATEDGPYYSAQTLKALVDSYGWEDAGNDSVVKAFPGVGPLGGQMVPDGTRKIYAGYRFDERKRHIAAIFGDDQLFDIDGRDREPADVARELNERVEAWVTERQAASGYAKPASTPAPAAAAVPDLSYRRSVDGLFTTFLPNTPEGEKAWATMNATQGSEGGKILAAHTDAVIQQIRDAGYTVAEDTTPMPATKEEIDALETALKVPPQPDEQPLIAAYARSFGEAAAVLNAAVAAVNWDGITDTATMRAELEKLNAASRAGQYDIIGKASSALEAVGIKTWDERLSGLRGEAGFIAWRDALDASSAALDKIQAIAKERLIAKGAAEVAALTAESPLADVAAAIFHKAGIETGAQTPQIVAAIEAKDAALVWSILRNLDNKASAEIFERATGVKLAKTLRDRRPQIDAWAGITPEQRAELEAQRTEAQAAKDRDENLKRAWNGLTSISVRANDGNVSNGQDFLKSLFARGFDEVVVRKRGAVPTYYMRNAESQITGVKSKSFSGFLKAALTLGGLRQALESLGVIEVQAKKTDADKIAAVDEAYRFTSATDEFKLWLHESLNKDGYSPFLTAKSMDEAAKRHGAEIEWGEFAGAAMDSVHTVAGEQFDGGEFDTLCCMKDGAKIWDGDVPSKASRDSLVERGYVERGEGFNWLTGKGVELVAALGGAGDADANPSESDYEPDETEIGTTFDVETALDSAVGAYVETDKRAIGAAKALLKYFRDFLASDAKLAQIPDQVKGLPGLLNSGHGSNMDKEQAKQALRSLIDIAINRKAGIPDPTPEEAQRLADYAHDARTISDYLTRRIRHTGARNLLCIPEMKAKYPHIDNQQVMDSVALDGVDDDGYVGKIKKGDQVLGRIDIADDGKAMVYVGEAGDERVKGGEGRPFMYSEDDAPKMVEALLATKGSPAAAQAEAFTGPAKDRMAALKVLTDTGMNLWMSEAQNKAVIAGLMGEEWQFFADKMKELANVIATMPKTYDQDDKGDDAVAYLHYFRGAGDWYITEKDMEGHGTEQAFGLADLHGDGGEMGYINIVELAEAGVELDFHFQPKTIEQLHGGEPVQAAPDDGNDPDAPGIYKRDAGYLAVKEAASILGATMQDAEVDGNLVINTSIAYGGKSLKVEISPHGWVNVGSAQIMIKPNITTESTATDGKAIAEAVKAQVEATTTEGDPGGGNPDATPIASVSAGETDQSMRAFAVATEGHLYDPDYKGGEWMVEAVETQETIADFVAASSGYQEASAPKFGQIAGFKFVAFSKVQMRKGDQRRALSVIDFGYARFAIDADLTSYEHEVWDGTYPDQAAAADQKTVDRALFQSVIDGTVPNILAPELADALEAAFNRNSTDADMVALFEQAVAAYQSAMLAATSALA